jgi:hypothetical protein
MVNYQIEVNTLYELLIGKDNGAFEAYRSKLIRDYGYDKFRAILKQASYKLNAVDYKFEQIAGN